MENDLENDQLMDHLPIIDGDVSIAMLNYQSIVITMVSLSMSSWVLAATRFLSKANNYLQVTPSHWRQKSKRG